MSYYDRLKEMLIGQCVAEILYLHEDCTYFTFKTQTGEIFTFSSEGEIVDEDGDESYVENYIQNVVMNLDRSEDYIGKKITSVVISGVDNNVILIHFGRDFITVEFGEEYYGRLPIVYYSRIEQ